MRNRHYYLAKIKKYIGTDMIKVITGMRRSGKSYFLRQLMEDLKQQGYTDEQIIYIDKESAEFSFIKDQDSFDSFLKLKFQSSVEKKFLFVDEVQEIESWEMSLRSVLKNHEAEVFITGSNANLLSSELATYIAGRYIEFPIFPLSFNEFLDFQQSKESDREKEFFRYMKFGAMPGIHHAPLEEDIVYPQLKAILNTVILKDVVARQQIRNYAQFERVLNFVLDNIASTFSAKSIADFLKSQRLQLSVDTVQNYLSFLESAFLLHKVRRYDLQGKRHLEIYEKYFVSDLAFRHVVLGYKDADINDFLENILFMDLLRRGYKVSIGKIADLEIDFIAERGSEKKYLQVCYLISDNKVLQRELKALERVADNYPKYILSLDKDLPASHNGIQWMNFIDFISADEI